MECYPNERPAERCSIARERDTLKAEVKRLWEQVAGLQGLQILQDEAEAEAEAKRLRELLRSLVNYIDNEGPAAKEWQAITDLCEQAHEALDAKEGKPTPAEPDHSAPPATDPSGQLVPPRSGRLRATELRR